MDGKPIESDVAAEKAEAVPSRRALRLLRPPRPRPVDDDELLDAYEPLRTTSSPR